MGIRRRKPSKSPDQIQITPFSRLRMGVIRTWYENVESEVQEVRQWLRKDLKARRGLERLCDEILKKSALEAVDKAVDAGTRDVSFTINLAKTAQATHQSLSESSPDAVQGISIRNILVGLELMLSEVGYPIKDHILSLTVYVPSPEEIEAERAARAMRERQALHEAEEAQRVAIESSQGAEEQGASGREGDGEGDGSVEPSDENEDVGEDDGGEDDGGEDDVDEDDGDEGGDEAL